MKIDQKIEDKQILFPEGLRFSFTFDDPDEMAVYGAKWKQEYYHISRGKFSGAMQAAHTRSLQIGRVVYSPGIFIRGDSPEKSVVFSISQTNSEPPVLHNEPLNNNDLIFFREGDEIDFLSTTDQDFLVLSIEREMFNRFSKALLGIEAEEIESQNKRLKLINESARTEIQDLWSNTLNIALLSENNLQDTHFAHILEEKLIESILSNIGPINIHISRIQRHHAAKMAKQYILENKNILISILDICEAVGATERTLHLGFKELYGITPKAFMKYLRLNNARKELLKSDISTTVTDVAYRWKFYHLSRFARSYNETFREKPSDTLKRSISLNFPQ